MGLIDPEYLRRHYAELSDEALMTVDRRELEVTDRRGLEALAAPILRN